MKNHEGAHSKSVSWAGPVALLGATGAAALGLWQAHDGDARLWPAVGLLALTAALGLVWLHRVRGARRFSPCWMLTPSGNWRTPHLGRTRIPWLATRLSRVTSERGKRTERGNRTGVISRRD